jgi:4-hydroxy-4-methyl-2-oxoglutarate aldolase
MADNIPTAELCDRYENVHSAAVADVLDGRGLLNQTIDRDLPPVIDGSKAAGIAYPLVGRPNAKADPSDVTPKMLQMMEDAPEHAMVVYDTNDTTSAQIGDLAVAALRKRECRGAVVDGGARDLAYIRDQEFPVFARYSTPAGAGSRWEALDWDVSTVVAGVEVSPGDVVLADVDGVVVVPKDIAEDVLIEAEEVIETEVEVREAVLSGSNLLEVFDEHEKF